MERRRRSRRWIKTNGGRKVEGGGWREVDGGEGEWRGVDGGGGWGGG